MKRILFFNDGMEMGGTEKLLVSLLNHLAKKEFQVTLLLPIPSQKNMLIKNVDSKIKIQYLYKENSSYLKRKMGESIMIFFPRFFAKWKGVKSTDYDLIVCFKETFYARMLSSMRVPKILWIHNILIQRSYEIHSLKERLSVLLNKKQIQVVQKSYVCFDRVICVSHAAKTAYLNVLNKKIESAEGIDVLYNAIDLPAIQGKVEDKVGEIICRNSTNFVLITRLSPDKRIDRLLKAAARLKDDGYSFHVYMVGAGMDSDEVKNQVSNLHLSDMITLIGAVENPYPYIARGTWSLCVSMRESFSLSLLESIALDVPVITTDCGGPRDIVADGKYGLLVENSSEGVYVGMKAVLDDPSLHQKYSENLDEALLRFDYQEWLNRIEEIFKEVAR